MVPPRRAPHLRDLGVLGKVRPVRSGRLSASPHPPAKVKGLVRRTVTATCLPAPTTISFLLWPAAGCVLHPKNTRWGWGHGHSSLDRPLGRPHAMLGRKFKSQLSLSHPASWMHPGRQMMANLMGDADGVPDPDCCYHLRNECVRESSVLLFLSHR